MTACPRARIPFLPALALLFACGGGDGRDSALPVVDTLPSGVVMVENALSDEAEDGPIWRVEEDLRIGAVASGGPDELSRIWGFTIDDEGNIYIIDGMAQDIRVFDSDGGYLRTIGGKGDGPGEFVGARGLAWGPEGNLYVYDPSARRFSVFTRQGEFLRSHPRDLTGVIMPWPGRFDRDGWLWDFGIERPGMVGNSPGTLVRRTFRRTSPDFSRHESPQPIEFREEDRMPSGLSRPFSDRPTTCFDPEGFFWMGRRRGDRVYKVTFDGDTIRGFTIPFAPVEISDFEVDSILAAYSPPGMPSLLDAGDIPDTKPLIRRIMMDDSGRLIIYPYSTREDQYKAFLVFDQEGVFLARGRSESRFYMSPGPQFIGDHVYGVVTDELDVSYLVRGRIER